MGTEMIAFVEYDTSPMDYPAFLAGKAIPEPFTDPDSIESLSLGPEGLNTGSKNYSVFAALAGVRSEGSRTPRFPPRGLPQDLSFPAEQSRQNGRLGEECNPGWLYLDEIREALSAHEVPEGHIATEIHVILDAMAALETRLGYRRTRLVFSFHG